MLSTTVRETSPFKNCRIILYRTILIVVSAYSNYKVVGFVKTSLIIFLFTYSEKIPGSRAYFVEIMFKTP